MKKKKKKKKEKINFQKYFCFSSLIFILVCIFWYGGRFTYFYLKNRESIESDNKTKVFANEIINNNFNTDTFKQVNDKYYFYGNATNNYVSYSNFLWRIVRINEDNSLMLVTDSVVGTLAYGNKENAYKESNLTSWLNDVNEGKFINVLNEYEKYLKNNSTCIDNIDDITNITCDSIINDNYLDLLPLEDYINTGASNSFINNNKYNYLANKNNNSEIWYITDEGKLSTSTGENIIGIKATITLNDSIKMLRGTGTIDDPYSFEENTNLLGSYVELDDSLWRIYENDSNIIKLVLEDNLKEEDEFLDHNYSIDSYYHNDTVKDSLAYYLNNTYYNTLSYKKLIVENTYSNSLYGKENNFDYKDIDKKKIETKVAVPSLDDVIYNDSLLNYFTSTGKDENEEAIFIRKEDGTATSKLVTTKTNIVPCISINKDDLKYGTGLKSDPYKLEE